MNVLHLLDGQTPLVLSVLTSYVMHKAALGERADGRVPRPAAFLYSHGLQLRGGGNVSPDSGTHTEGS
jgi:hypothetical protein